MSKKQLDEKIKKMMEYKKEYEIKIGPSGEEIHIEMQDKTLNDLEIKTL